jgi:hypothetical protein
MRRASIAIALSVALMGGCSTFRDLTGQRDYTVTSATPTSITIRFKEGELSQAQSRAEAHCTQYRRTAVMQNVSPDGGESVGVFNCA